MAKKAVPQNNWNHYFEDLQYSSKDFYEKLKALIAQYEFPDIKLSLTTYSEGGLLSSKREYLLIEWKEYRVDVCAAPFGKNFFVSWWLSDIEEGCLSTIVLSLPIVGRMYRRSMEKKTFYEIDTEAVFKASIHALIVKTIDSIMPENGYRMPDAARALPQAAAQ